MKVKLFIIFLFFTLICIHSQEKKETEDWIREKTAKFYYLNNLSTPKRFISFRDGNLIFAVANYDGSNYNTATEFRSIKISDIKKIEIKKIYLDKDIWIVKLYCDANKNCATNRYEYHWNKTYESKTEHSISLEYNSDFANENLPERMGKALKDLVRLNNGTANILIKKEKY